MWWHNFGISRSLTFAGICCIASQGLAQFDFDPAVAYGPLLRPSGVAVGDFNGDTQVDMATTANGVDRVVLFPNNGDGTFGATSNVLLPASSSPQDLIAGDFDGDMDLDLAVALRDPAGSVQLLMNNGSGLFVAEPTRQ